MSAPIKFRFDPQKATEAAAWLLQRDQGTMPYIRLIKMLYIAEREALRSFGRPILGDFYVSMKNGPVLSNLYSLIMTEGVVDRDPWSRFIKRTDFDLTLLRSPGVANLSEAETELLDTVFRDCIGKGKWDLVDLTHTFPEWRNPGRSMQPIAVEEILKALGMSDEDVRRIRDTAAEEAQIDEVLGN